MSEVEPFQIDERIQRQVWRGLGTKPLKQIAEETGLDRDQIIRIREELLSSVDDLTIQQKRQKLIMSLEEMSQVARDDYDKAPYEFKSGLLNSAVSAIAKIQAELARMSKADDGKIEALNNLRRREIVRMYTSVVDAGVEEIAEEYGLDADALFDVFNRLMSEYAARNQEGV